MRVKLERPLAPEDEVVIRMTMAEARALIAEGFETYSSQTQPIAYALYHAVEAQL